MEEDTLLNVEAVYEPAGEGVSLKGKGEDFEQPDFPPVDFVHWMDAGGPTQARKAHLEDDWKLAPEDVKDCPAQSVCKVCTFVMYPAMQCENSHD
eukprot:1456408-Rhodomonas_salina.1